MDPLRLAERAGDRALVEGGEVADRVDAEPLEASRASTGPTPHSRPTGSGCRKSSSSPGPTSTTPGPGTIRSGGPAAWPRPTPAWRGTCSARPRPSTSSSSSSCDVGADPLGDRGALAEQPGRAGDVEERLVERQRFDERRVAAEDLVHLLADLGVQRRGRRAGTRRAGTGAGPPPTAAPSARRTAGPRTTPPRPRHAARCHRRRPAARRSSGRRRSSTDTKNASMSTCRMVRVVDFVTSLTLGRARPQSHRPSTVAVDGISHRGGGVGGGRGGR